MERDDEATPAETSATNQTHTMISRSLTAQKGFTTKDRSEFPSKSYRKVK